MAGDVVGSRQGKALASLVLSLAVAVLVGYATRDYIQPKGGAQGAISTIWWISVAVGVIGLGLALVEIRFLRREWGLLGDLATTRLAEKSPSLRAADGGASRSVVLRQASLVADALVGGRVPAGDFHSEWRRQATERTSHYGSTQRFLASALLLLAVLGTFAGLKAALPELIAAMGAPDPTVATRAITTGLTLVADAFGANLIALLASLVLAGTGFGLARERRDLLVGLDDVATRIWYPLLPAEAGLSGLERAIVEMRGTVTEVGRVGDVMGTLGHRLDDFKVALVDAMQRMVGDVRASVQASSISADQRQAAQLTQVTQSLALITRAFEQTAIGYQGLVKGLEERDLGVTTAAEALSASAGQLKTTSEALAATSADLTRHHAAGEDRTNELRGEVTKIVELGGRVVSRIDAAIATQTTALEDAATVVARFERSHAEHSDKATDAFDAQLKALTGQNGQLMRLLEAAAAIQALGSTSNRLLEGVQTSLETGSKDLAARTEQIVGAHFAHADSRSATVTQAVRKETDRVLAFASQREEAAASRDSELVGLIREMAAQSEAASVRNAALLHDIGQRLSQASENESAAASRDAERVSLLRQLTAQSQEASTRNSELLHDIRQRLREIAALGTAS